MPLPTEVSLPREAKPHFPDQCVVCQSSSPGATSSMKASELSWLNALGFTFGNKEKLEFPACKPCGRKLKLQRLGRTVGVLIFTVVFFKYVWMPYGDEYVPDSMRKIVAMAVVLVALLPYFLWQALRPLAFDVTVHKESIDYEFKSPGYANAFIEANVEHLEHQAAVQNCRQSNRFGA